VQRAKVAQRHRRKLHRFRFHLDRHLQRYRETNLLQPYVLVLVNGVDLTGLLGGHKGRLGVWGTEVPQRGQVEAFL